MKTNSNHTNELVVESDNDEEIDLMGYSFLYPIRDDIYNKFKKESEINPEDTSEMKEPSENDDAGIWNEKEFIDEVLGRRSVGDDLDVPGSELDDKQEDIGSEDEENNYYSIGGDNHNELEEDKGT